ncbi:hypothetical protein J3F83DRAFT_763685 [Trichoderma novae-zelandiae]
MLRLALLPLLTGAALAATGGITLTSTGCADSSGFESCQKQADDQLSSCIAQANKDDSQLELLACGCQNYVDNYNCYSSFCWNRVWECEYQEYIIDYFVNCATAKLPVPYFPAPNKVPDACSCNVGKVFLAIQDAIQETATCSNNADSGDASSNLQQIQGCDCCEISGALSSLYNICPDTDPKLIGLSTISQLESQLNTDFDSCGPYLDTYDCVTALGYSLDGVSKYYKPTDITPSGTATLSNAAGTVTSPASGTVFTYTNGGDGTIYTITAAGHVQGSGDSGSGSDTGSGSGGSGGGSHSSHSQTAGSSDAAGATASSQGTATAASPTKTGSKSGAGATTASLYLAAVAMAVPLVACF